MKTAPPYLTHELWHHPGSRVSTWIRNRQWTLQPMNLTRRRSIKAWPGAKPPRDPINSGYCLMANSPLQITSVLCQASEESRLILFWSKENIPSVLKLPRGQIFANLIFILSATVLGTSVWEVPSYLVSSSSPLKPFLCLKSPWNYLVPWLCSWSSSEEIDLTGG